MTEYRGRQEPPRGGFQRSGPGGYPPQPPFQAPSRQQLEAIILEGDARALVDSARALGDALARRGLTTSQIRGVFGTVRQIQMKWPYGASEAASKASMRQLLLLKPKLAYQAERSGAGVAGLRDTLVPAIDLVTDREHFSHLVDYFEAILAYHKAAGGRD